MMIYDSSLITLNGKEIAIHLADTADLINYMAQLPHWDFLETEPIARELCDRLGVDFDDYEDYDALFDSLSESYATGK